MPAMFNLRAVGVRYGHVLALSNSGEPQWPNRTGQDTV